MKPCVTISLVPEARGGPFIFWEDLSSAFSQASELGFSGVEIFAPSAAEIPREQLQELVQRHRLAVAAFGTGGGWVRDRLTLTSPSADVRQRARQFIVDMINAAAPFHAGVIIGSLQGRFEGEVTHTDALNHLGEALAHLADYAHNLDVTILYEHLNRYETNLLNRIEDVIPFISPFQGRVKVLADLFHMNIEEASIPDAIRTAGDLVGHVHFADSNRRPVGLGHTDFKPIFTALREIDYQGYVSAEALPYPNPAAAARQTIDAFRELTT